MLSQKEVKEIESSIMIYDLLIDFISFLSISQKRRGRDGNGYSMGRVLQCPSPYPHL